MLGSAVPMVPTPGAGGSALEKNLRFLVLVREREEEIELEILNFKKAFGLL